MFYSIVTLKLFAFVTTEVFDYKRNGCGFHTYSSEWLYLK